MVITGFFVMSKTEIERKKQWVGGSNQLSVTLQKLPVISSGLGQINTNLDVILPYVPDPNR